MLDCFATLAMTKDALAMTKDALTMTKSVLAMTKNTLAMTKDALAMTKNALAMTYSCICSVLVAPESIMYVAACSYSGMLLFDGSPLMKYLHGWFF